VPGWNVLSLVAPRHGPAIDVAELLGNTRANPVGPGLTCQGPAWCSGQPVPSVLVPTPGQVMFLHVARNITGVRMKVLTPVVEPHNNNQVEWPGMELSVVLAHSSIPAHWIAFCRVRGVWWRADSARVAIVQENPFAGQIQQPQADLVYTVEVLMFRG
jgi:hypothetical protein